MELTHVGSTHLTPEAQFYWDQDNSATVEITKLSEGFGLLRASKTYRIVKQDREGQENWDSNLRNLNEYLADTFPGFRIAVNYVNEVDLETTEIPDDVQDAKTDGEQLFERKEKLEQQAERNQRSAEFGLEEFEDAAKDKVRKKKSQLENVEAKLDRLTSYLQRKKSELREWRRNGVMLAYLFTFFTQPEVVPVDCFREYAQKHVDEAFNMHRRKVKQTLEGANWKLVINEVAEPQVLNRLEHTSLLNPEAFSGLVESNPDLEESLKDLRRDSLAQYEAFALQDLEFDGTVFERSKATPAQAVNGLLQSLESENISQTREAPNDGPYVGNVAGTQQVVGFDPAEVNHYYLAGKTGSGKTGLKRVLLENAASLGYNVLSIVPTDKEGIGVSFPSRENENGQALKADQYWPEHDRLLDWPSEVSELLEGLNVVTLEGVMQERSEELVDEIFGEVYQEQYSEDEPLFLFVEEAQNFDSGRAAESLKSLVKEKRKDNVHVVIITQNPKEFKRKYASIRRNTTTMFLRGEYFSYAEDFDLLESEREVQKLDPQQVIFHSMDWNRFTVDVRPTLSFLGQPSEKQIDRLDSRFSANSVDLSEAGDGSTSDGGRPDVLSEELSDDEADLLAFIHDFIESEENEFDAVSASNCHRDGPVRSDDAREYLDKLTEKGLLEKKKEVRKHNNTVVFRPK
jgi:predicted transcriptional regulator